MHQALGQQPAQILQQPLRGHRLGEVVGLRQPPAQGSRVEGGEHRPFPEGGLEAFRLGREGLPDHGVHHILQCGLQHNASSHGTAVIEREAWTETYLIEPDGKVLEGRYEANLGREDHPALRLDQTLV